MSDQENQYILDINTYNQLKQELKCSICHDFFIDAQVTECIHIFCKKCIYGFITASRSKGTCQCPLCKAIVSRISLQPILQINNLVATIQQINMKTIENNIQQIPIQEVKEEQINKKSIKDIKLKIINNQNSDKKISKPKPNIKKQQVIVPEIIEDHYKDYHLTITSFPNNFDPANFRLFSEIFNIRIEHNYSQNVTHVIVKPQLDDYQQQIAPRTIKYLLGVINDQKIVSYDWITDSIQNKSLQNYQNYLIKCKQIPHIISQNHKNKTQILTELLSQMSFKLIKSKFDDIGISKLELGQLILNCNGKLCTYNRADESWKIKSIKIEPDEKNIKVYDGRYDYENNISASWIIDSISNECLLDYKQYILT